MTNMYSVGTCAHCTCQVLLTQHALLGLYTDRHGVPRVAVVSALIAHLTKLMVLFCGHDEVLTIHQEEVSTLNKELLFKGGV